jgi:hypothetical protein
MTQDPLPSWQDTGQQVAARLAELAERLEQPFADITDDEEPRRARALDCLSEARGILTGEWSHRVPDGLIGMGVQQARRIILDAGLAVRLTRQDGVTEGPHGLLGPGTWVVAHTVPRAGDYLSRGAEVVLQLAKRGPHP